MIVMTLVIAWVIGWALGFGCAWLLLEGWREWRCLAEIDRYELARRKIEAEVKARWETVMHLPSRSQ